VGSREKASARCGGLAAVVAGILVSSSAIAQPPPATPLLNTILSQSWVRFEVASGRVAMRVAQPAQTGTMSSSGTRLERISVRALGNDRTIDYELTTPEEEFSLRFSSATRMEIHRLPKGDSKITAVEYDQPATGPITLKVGVKDVREYRAASLWHLLLTEPAACRESLLPLLGLLRPNWALVKTGDEVQAVLLRMAQRDVRPDQKQWSEWVRQLDDDQFTKREAADRQLRDSGRAVVSYLQQLDPARLDAEQQFRIHRIISALTSTSGDDTPEQVAALLFADAGVWMAMLASPEESARRIAAKQLGTLRGGPVAFDPAADPQTRKKQIEALRGKEGKG
jgi:hypothetical protein